MNLDDLIERLQTLRRECPAAGTATVVGFMLDEPRYSHGEVRFGDFDPDNVELIKVDLTAPPEAPSVH